MIDYWTAEGHAFPEQELEFTVKVDTDLYALAKAKTSVQSLEVSRDGSEFATISADRQRTSLLGVVPPVPYKYA